MTLTNEDKEPSIIIIETKKQFMDYIIWKELGIKPKKEKNN